MSMIASNQRPKLMPKSCFSCRDRKQRCDRSAPQCIRCQRLMLQCNYPEQREFIPSHSNVKEQFWDKDIRSLQEALHTADHQVLVLLEFTQAHKHDVFATAGTIYTAHVYRWLPIIGEKDLHAAIEPLEAKSGLDVACLLFSVACLCLTESHLSPELREVLATAVRILYSQAQLEQCSITLVQAGLLFATYEYGQGEMDRAYSLIDSCRSMAQQLGIISEELSAADLRVGMPTLSWIILLLERLILFECNSPAVSMIEKHVGWALRSTWATQDCSGDTTESRLTSNLESIRLLDRVLFVVRSVSPTRDEILASLDLEMVRFLAGVFEEDAKFPGRSCQSILIGSLSFLYLQMARFDSFNRMGPEVVETEKATAVLSATRVIRVLGETIQEHIDNAPISSAERHSLAPPWAVMVVLRGAKTIVQCNLSNLEPDLGTFRTYAKLKSKDWGMANKLT